MFLPKSGRQDYCNDTCKKSFYYTTPDIRQLECAHCRGIFSATGSTSKFCSVECRNTFNKHKTRQLKFCQHCDKDISETKNARKFCSTECNIKFRLAHVNSGIDGVDYITCPICDRRVKQISHKHAKMHGFASPSDMRNTLGIITTCSSKCEKHSGENNPGYKHGGKFSKLSKAFIHGYDGEWHGQFKENNKEHRKKHPEKYMSNIEYWINQTGGDLQKARDMYKLSQTRDLSYFVNKYGEDEGRKRHLSKIEKWINSFKKQNFSKISQELFDGIISSCKALDLTQVYYATFDREDKIGYANKEYRLKLDSSYILPDFIYLISKRIIEFDGSYWHSSQVANPEKERVRDLRIKEAGYEVLHVSETHFKQNKEQVIQECINFLTK
jgi:hypothetical protein